MILYKKRKLQMLFSVLLFGAVIAFTFPDVSEADALDAKTEYDFSKPRDIFVLPSVLNEISGITAINDDEIACVQDEKGIIFIFNLQQKKVTDTFSIAVEGDYEGVAQVNDTMYVLRSDGTLLEVKNYKSKNKVLHSYPLELASDDNEGLCYDQQWSRLLIACKGKIGKGPAFKDIRVIYSFDLKRKKIEAEPVIEFSVKKMEEFARKNNIQLPVKERRNGEGTTSALRFMPSAIAIHPLTDELYLLSAIDGMLLVLDQKGNIKHLQQLNINLFNKPEGITFLNNGDVFISNEAEEKKPTLLRFNYR